ncbi:MAG: HAD family hydrolase [Alphaproteobacteria bacterium]|nr:HAD family hydrolase [Alphaproteobacteria bacterium]
MPKAIIFDWDQTLAHTDTAIIDSLKYTLKKYGKEPWNVVKTKYHDIKKPIKDNFLNFFGNKAKEAYQDYLENYNQNGFSKVYPTEHAVDFLYLCQQKNISLYIVSSKEPSLLQKEVRQCFPDIDFSQILGYGATSQNKPAPDPVFKALENISYPINSHNVWLIGDSQQDIDCAYNANILPILLGNGNLMEKNYIKEHQQKEPPLLVFKNFKEISAYLETTETLKS